MLARLEDDLSMAALFREQQRIGGEIRDGKLYPIGPHLTALLPLDPACKLERRWHVVQVEPQQEKPTARRMDEDCKIDGWCPCESKSVRLNALKRRIRDRPMLTGYVFAGFDVLRDNWKIIPSLRGVVRLFMVDMRPVPVPDKAIERVRAKEVELNTGGLSRLLADLPAKIGDWVQIIEHPSFSGLIGLVIDVSPNKWRVKVELDFFGQKVPVDLTADQVRLAG